MLIVKEEALSCSLNTYFYQDKPFTGMAIQIEDGLVTGRKRYEGGLIVAENGQVELPIPLAPSCIMLDEKLLEFTEGPVLYNEATFNGCGFEFFGDVCHSISEYDYGFSCATAKFDEGRLIELSFEDVQSEIYQHYKWDESGAFSVYEISSSEEFNFSVMFHGGLIRYVRLAHDYVSVLEKIHSNLKFGDFDFKGFLRNYRFADDLILVDDDVILAVLTSQSITLKSIEIRNSKVTEKSFKKLEEIRDLKELAITSSEPWVIAALDKFKHNRPDCDVYLNLEEVV